MAKLKQRSGKQKVLKQKKKFGERLVIGKSKVAMKKQLKKKEDQSHESDFEITVENANSKIQIEAFDEKSAGHELNTREMVKKQNKKQQKSGGFQAMGLSHQIFKGVIRKGYKVPTPIQRKTVPLIMDGKDVVAMARTGSGKTAAFLVPMFEKLQAHSTKGARALILSPTRELAIQTMKFTKDLGKYTDLKFTLILGGDRVV
ncbi:ATP-dependent RNA helicase DDX54-like [Hydractinia symbiolongicarpus]|uniref:ATP-dependent RNA helicase DDX54-like n=1 Tax=Hydractinia symbiolongicarpus TaxID=13093 RepID=UPI00254D5AC5|nr:ATP-dependent RNA helicase DDX54-like [Hydractinia symbiolongicarpus]